MNQEENKYAGMTQDEINQAEWENPANWTKGSKLFCVYFSHKDTRTWVPKLYPWMGSTMNLGQVGGVLWLGTENGVSRIAKLP